MQIENTSGLIPCEYKILVKPDAVEESSPGNIYYPPHVVEKEMRERVDVTLVAAGGCAFSDPDWGVPRPQPGDRVKIAKYAGYFFKGADGAWYQICSDKDICGILVQAPAMDLADTDQPDNAGDGIYGHLRSV